MAVPDFNHSGHASCFESRFESIEEFCQFISAKKESLHITVREIHKFCNCPPFPMLELQDHLMVLESDLNTYFKETFEDNYDSNENSKIRASLGCPR